jgi:hypothetical protein
MPSLGWRKNIKGNQRNQREPKGEPKENFSKFCPTMKGIIYKNDVPIL